MPSRWRKSEVTEAFHLGQALPAQRLDPAQQEVQHARACLVGPETIELLPQHVGFEQAAVRGEQRLELGTLRAAHGLPAAPQQPPPCPGRGPTLIGYGQCGESGGYVGAKIAYGRIPELEDFH